MYRLDDIVQQYGERTVLALDSLEIEAGKVLALLGPSGAGKSTLLRLLNFLEQPTRGTIRFDHHVVSSPDLTTMRSITTVFQRPLLLDTTVRKNVTYGLRLRGRHAPAAVDQVLATLGLERLADARARTLSGGEMQRVALARALVIEPRVLLLDEPTANLDPANVAIIEAAVRDLPARQGTTVVLATHNLHQARRLAGCIAVLLDGQLIEFGLTSEILTAPRDPRTRAFLSGDMVY
jgi:tungstate transport system ATP-binding protein